ncbi:hypothetical protein CA267_013235 [Alteromonas pelagimontana]|uniref:Uncharacterized protein n=1 Tax=Alteromonas pelagimontana TaxID=1858656 RepID=A0A6M4MEQ2_9ALTE|nr:hypothetical protein [Alteromonas pelagimontana]QJR81661.1 hypothetical protein CA267_013235 [Alteromonas pelagimontana]
MQDAENNRAPLNLYFILDGVSAFCLKAKLSIKEFNVVTDEDYCEVLLYENKTLQCRQLQAKKLSFELSYENVSRHYILEKCHSQWHIQELMA